MWHIKTPILVPGTQIRLQKFHILAKHLEARVLSIMKTRTFSFMSSCSRSTSGCSATMERRECGKHGTRFCRHSSDCTSTGICSTAYIHITIAVHLRAAFIFNTNRPTYGLTYLLTYTYLSTVGNIFP